MKPTHLLSSLIFILLLAFGASGLANADLKDRSDEICKKVKSCAILELEKQGLPQSTIQQMAPLFENMCAPAVERYGLEIADKPGLEKKAEACIDTIVNASCEELTQSRGEYNTPACDEFKNASEAYGIDPEQIGREAAGDLLTVPAPEK